MNRNTASTISAMTPASMALLLGHERRGAPDLDHVHPLALLDHLILVVRPGRPHLALELDAALALREALDDRGGAADQRRRPRAQLRRHAAVRARERPQRREQDPGDDEEH